MIVIWAANYANPMEFTAKTDNQNGRCGVPLIKFYGAFAIIAA